MTWGSLKLLLSHGRAVQPSRKILKRKVSHPRGFMTFPTNQCQNTYFEGVKIFYNHSACRFMSFHWTVSLDEGAMSRNLSSLLWLPVLLSSAKSACKSLPFARLLNSTDLEGIEGYRLWHRVINLLIDWRYFLVISSFMICATLLV